MIRFAACFVLSTGLLTACTHISGSRITGANLARAIPEFETIPAATVLAYAPGVGSQRVFRPDELQRIATKYQLPVTATVSICFDWELRPISTEQAITAMRASFPDGLAAIEIVRLTNAAAPAGELVFPRENLANSMWRGYVLYGDNQKFEIWAEVRIPFDVKGGDTVQVRAVSNRAVIVTEAQAAGSGRIGDTILLRNPASGKAFRGQVAGKGKVLITS